MAFGAIPWRLDEPRFRSWVQAAVGIALPVAMWTLLWIVPVAGLGSMLLLMASIFGGLGLSMMALFSSLAGLFALQRPRPRWRYAEALLLGLPFLAFVGWFATLAAMKVIYS